MSDSEQTYLLFGKITAELCRDAIEWIVENNEEIKPHDFLTLIINSEGGDLYSAFALIDMMNLSKIPIRTFGVGEIVSSAFLIFINGEKGTRTLSENVSVMTHSMTHGTEGKYHDLKSFQKECDMLHEKMVLNYVRCTGMTRAKIEKTLLTNGDVFLTTKEAISFGVADKIAK